MSYVARMLRNRQLLGEFQPCTAERTNGKAVVRKPAGDIIRNYYPAVLSENEFYAAQVRAGRGRPKGRVGDRVEILSGLLKNARDGDAYYVASRAANLKSPTRGVTGCWSTALVRKAGRRWWRSRWTFSRRRYWARYFGKLSRTKS
jgi:hypothetical protein